MKKVQKILAVVLAVALLVSSGVPGMASVFAADVKDTEAVTERTTEHAEQKTVKSAEAETVHAAESEGKTAGNPTESETQKQTESETQKQTESETPETKKPLPMQPETKEPETPETEKPKKTVKANGVSITAVYDAKQKKNIVNDPDLALLIPDPAFQQAIYDNFAENNWLAGDPENPPSTTDESGNSRARIEILKEILGTYAQAFDASDRGIEDVRGIRYLRLVASGKPNSINCVADFSNNNIESLMPLVNLDDPKEFCFGEHTEGVSGKRSRLYFGYNPIKYFPNTEIYNLGYMIWTDISDNTREVVDSSKLKYYFLRDDAEVYSGILPVGYCHYGDSDSGEFVPLRTVSFYPTGESQRLKMNKIGLETKPELNRNEYVYYKDLKKNAYGAISVTTEDFLRTWSTNSFGESTYNEKSYVYRIRPSFTIFDHVTIKDDAQGSIQIRKIDGLDSSKGLKGARFKLYTDKDCTQEAKKIVRSETGGVITEREEEIGSLVTDENGYTEKVQGLRRGTYYYKEIEAPQGYVISDKVSEVVIGYNTYLDGGLRSLKYTNPEGSELEDINVELDQNDHKNTYITWKMEELYGGSPVDFYLLNGKNERVEEAAEGQIKAVTVKYSSLDGTKHDEVYTYNSDENSGLYCVDPLTRAQNNLNSNIKENKITGSVSVEITYNDQNTYALSVSEAENMPAIDVKVDKSWKGIDLVNDKDFPNVSYTLYRYQSAVTYAEEKEKTDGASEEELKAFEKQLSEELERLKTEEGKVIDSIAINSDTAQDYIHTFQHLPKYAKVDTGRKDADGNAIYEYYLYLYDVEEKVMQGDEFDSGVETESGNGTETGAVYDFSKYRFEDETVADKTGPILTKKENDAQLNADLLTYSITNYRKAIVEITKHDASGDRTAQGSLEGVEFKLEKANLDAGGNVVFWSEMKDIDDRSRFITDKNGKLQLRWLEIGKYRITETKTWAAYMLLPEPLEFEITKENMQTPNNIIYMVSNHSRFSVPQSGGIGTIWYYVSGCLLILAGGLWVYRKRLSINGGKE